MIYYFCYLYSLKLNDITTYKIVTIKVNLGMKNFLDISDLDRDSILHIFDLSKKYDENFDLFPLKHKSIGLIFEKYSTRTRISFQVGISNLGGNSIDIKFEELNFQRSESFEDTFKIFSQYLDLIIYRTSDHSKLLKAYSNFKKPIINALSDRSHPCQIISDMFTLHKRFHSFDNLNISWFGDMNNVLFSYFQFLEFFPEVQLNLFTDRKIYNQKKNYFPQIKNLDVFFELDQNIISKTDCIMTDVYTSMNDTESKSKETDLLKFQVNTKIMNNTKNECIFAHCLPAKIGSEVTKEVLYSEKSIVLEQARNRLVAQKGILSWIIN